MQLVLAIIGIVKGPIKGRDGLLLKLFIVYLFVSKLLCLRGFITSGDSRDRILIPIIGLEFAVAGTIAVAIG